MMVDPKDLKFNSYNPNVLPPSQFKRAVLEIRKAGTNAKAVKVRHVGDTLEIVDGEWTVRAAIEAGLDAVQCDDLGVISDFEARRLTVISNIHGDNDPVKLGYVARQMLEMEPNLGQVALAEMLGVSQATVSNRLAYAALADKAKVDRTLPPVSEISKMSVRQVKELLADLNSDDETTEKKVVARPIDKAKKAFGALSDEDRAAFVEWISQNT